MKKTIIYFKLCLILLLLVSCNTSPDENNDPVNISFNQTNNHQNIVTEENQDQSKNTETQENNSDNDEQSIQEEKNLKGVEIGVDILNIRSDSSTTSDILGQFKLGDQIDVIDEHIDLNGDIWYSTLYKGKNGYIAKRFTTDDERHLRVYDQDTLLGFYGHDDLLISQNPNKLVILKNAFFEHYIGSLGDKEVSIYKAFNQNMPLSWDAVLDHNGYLVKTTSKDTQGLYLIHHENALILNRRSHSNEDTYVLLLESKAVELGSTYSISDNTSELVYINPLQNKELIFINLSNDASYSLDFDHDIVDFDLTAEAYVTTIDGQINIEKSNEKWTYSEDGLSKQLYKKENYTYIPVDIALEDYHPVWGTNTISIENNTFYKIYVIPIDDNTYYKKEMIPEGQPVVTTEEGFDFYMNGNIHTFIGHESFIHRFEGDNCLITFNKDKNADYGYDEDIENYLVTPKSNYIHMKNLITFSQDGNYFITANASYSEINDIEVYDANTMDVIHTIQDTWGENIADTVENAWIDNTISFNTLRHDPNSWHDLSTLQTIHHEFFNPFTLESDSIILDETTEQLRTYNAINGQDQGYADVTIAKLKFADTISVNDGQLVFWFKHDNLYLKRFMHDQEWFQYETKAPLTFITDNHEIVTLGYTFTHMTFNNDVINSNIVLSSSPYYGLTTYELFNIQTGSKVPIGGPIKVSPNGQYAASRYENPIELISKFEIIDLTNHNIVFEHSYEFTNPENPFHEIHEFEWLDDQTLSVQFSEYLEGEQRERFIHKTDTGYELTD